MSRRRLVAIGAGVAGVAYGGLTLALAPTREAIRGWRALRSLDLTGALDAIAAETNEHIDAVAAAMGTLDQEDKTR